MPAALTDKFKKVGASTVTTLAAPGKALAANSINVGSTDNYPTDTGIIIAIRTVDTDGELVSGTYTEWEATVSSATALSIDPTPVYGDDQVYSAGSTTQVFIPTSAYAQNELIEGLLVSHEQDGTLNSDAIAQVTPPGVIEMYGGASAPTGWLLCDGSSLLRASYADLFAVIGTTFGAADGTHFNVPDLRDTFPIGKSGTKALGSTGGSATHTHTGPSHTHTSAAHTHEVFHTSNSNGGDIYTASGTQIAAGGSVQSGAGADVLLKTAPNTNTTYQTGSTTPGETGASGTGNTGATSTLPTYVALNYIIKT